MKRFFSVTILVLVLLVSFTFAQRQTGSIFGTIYDNQGNPLPGVSVTVSGPSLIGEMTYTTDVSGVFRFPALPPGEYTVKAELEGFKTLIRKGIIVNVGKTTEISLTLELAPVKEEIVVTAVSPTVDVQSAKTSVTYEKDFLISIPVNRDLYDIQNSIPGAVSEGVNYRRTSSILGGTVRSQLYALDGVPMNDPATFYSMANINFDVYQEIEFEVGAHPAEVGQTDSTYINIVTKSGGNKLSGGITAYFTNDNMAKDLFTKEQIKAFGVNPPEKYSDYKDGSFSLGGPIKKDKIWYFGNLRRQVWGQANPLTPESRMEKLGKPSIHYDLEHQEWMGFAKITAQLRQNLRYMGMFHYNHIYEPIYSNSIGSDTDFSATEIWDHENTYTTTHQLNWILNQNTFVDLRGTYIYRYFPIISRNPGEYTYYDRKNDVYWGTSPYNDEYVRIKMLASASLTRFVNNFLGANHEFKTGIEGEQSEYHRDWYRKNPYYSYWYDYAAGNPYYYSPSAKRGRLRIRPCPPERGMWDVQDNVRRLSWYVQDNITKGRLALNLGVRLDYSYQYEPEQSRPELRYENGPDLLAPGLSPNALLEALIAQMHAQGLISPFDALKTPFKKPVEFFTVSPRIGIVYDIFGNGKTALKVSYGRYYEPVWSAKYNAAQIFGASSINWYWNDKNGNKKMDLPPTDTYDLTSYSIQDPNYTYYVDDLKCPHMDEVLAGIEHELFKDFRLGIQLVWKQNKNIVEDIDMNNGYDPNAKDEKGLIWIPYTVVDPGWDGIFGTPDDKPITVYGLRSDRPVPSWKGINPPEAKREYKALVITFDKRMSNRWQLKGSVVYSSFKGNAEATYGATEGETGMFDSPNSMINSYGPIWFDRPLQVKILGTYVFPLDFKISANIQYLSGSPWERTLGRVYFPPNFGVQQSYVSVNAEPRGSQRSQSYTNMDLRVEKSFSFGKYGQFDIYLDIFNLGGYSRVYINQNPAGWLYYYESPPRYVTDPNYKLITSVEGVRSFRFGVRWNF